MSIIGIDPGQRGGIAIIGDGDDKVYPMLDPFALFCYLIGDRTRHVFIEKAQAMPKQGVVSMFKYGVGYGELLGVIKASQVPFTEVRPQTWKKAVMADMDRSDKASSIKRAKQLFPHLDFRATERCRKESDGMCEAALIAYYGANVR